MDFERFDRALRLAADVHRFQKRKQPRNASGAELPYIVHPVEVSALVQRYGGTEEQIIAALLHDVLEDGSAAYREQIRTFGDDVLTMVEACSETDVIPKPPWLERKRIYLAHLRANCEAARRDPTAADASILVTACDKLANLQGVHLDLTEVGEEIFDRFNVRKRATLWFFEQVVGCYDGVLPPALQQALTRELDAVFALAGTAPGLPEPSEEDLRRPR